MGFHRCICRSFAEIASPGFCHSAALVLIFLLVPVSLRAQPGPKGSKSPAELLQQHYDAARTFQISGDQQQAAVEYKAFLAESIREIGDADFNAEKYEEANKSFSEALALAPQNADVNLDYAALRLEQGNPKEAQTLAERAVELAPNNGRSHYLLGAALFHQQDYAHAKEHLEKAVVLEPKFEVGYLLGITYIKLNDLNRATLLFNEMVTGLGDTAQIHVLFGRAYREGDFLDQAISELHKALAKDGRIKAAHYLLAMAYLERDGNSGFDEAVPELQGELKVNPDDARTHYMLGYIALKRQDAKQAEEELAHAAKLDPENPDPLISLGQVYFDAGRLQDAERTFRQAIAVTKDPSRNDYQINRAHYALGRILLQTGREEEGKKELLISAELRDKPHSVRRGTAGPSDAPVSDDTKVSAVTAPNAVSPAQSKESTTLAEELNPLIADAYNNLGVIAASNKDYSSAMGYFEKAGVRNPALETLDRNFGMAAFYANQFDRAIVPLSRHLEQHPDDLRARAALGLSLFGVQDYKRVIETLQSIEATVDADAGLGYAYAVSQVKAGAYTQGIQRLRGLEKADPKSTDIHTFVGEALVEQGQYAEALEEYRAALAMNPNLEHAHFLAGLALIRQGNAAEAAQEFRAALKLDPGDVSSKYHLAYALIQMQKQEEAVQLLREVIGQDPKYADAYYQLGKVQLEKGNTQEAVFNLEAGIRLNPEGDYIHYQLALAYRRQLREEDAEREMKVYQALKDRHRGRNAAQQN